MMSDIWRKDRGVGTTSGDQAQLQRPQAMYMHTEVEQLTAQHMGYTHNPLTVPGVYADSTKITITTDPTPEATRADHPQLRATHSRTHRSPLPQPARTDRVMHNECMHLGDGAPSGPAVGAAVEASRTVSVGLGTEVASVLSLSGSLPVLLSLPTPGVCCRGGSRLPLQVYASAAKVDSSNAVAVEAV